MSADRSPPSSLVFLASGATQHVFTADDDDAVVYKVPAIFPELQPQAFSISHFRPVRPWKARLWAGARAVVPDRLQRSASPLLAGYQAYRNRARFGQMIEIMRELEALNHADALLPFAVIDTQFTMLATPAGVREYAGPMLVQRRATSFLTGPEGTLVDTDTIVASQHDLWSVGVGLDDRATVVGPHNWAILNGAMRLGDTGSLTRDRERARAMLEPAALDRTCRRVVQRCSNAENRRIALVHLEQLRRHITVHEFDRRWRTSIDTC